VPTLAVGPVRLVRDLDTDPRRALSGIRVHHSLPESSQFQRDIPQESWCSTRPQEHMLPTVPVLCSISYDHRALGVSLVSVDIFATALTVALPAG